MPDVGDAFYTAATGLSVVFFGFANIGPRPIMIVFLSDGSIVQFYYGEDSIETVKNSYLNHYEFIANNHARYS